MKLDVHSLVDKLKWFYKNARCYNKIYSGKSGSQIFKLWKPLKISRNFVYRANKRYKELWGVEDRTRSGRLKRVKAEAAIKTVWEQIRLNPLWKQKIMSRELNKLTQSSRASSGTIKTWERPSAQRGTSLILFWRRSDGVRANCTLQWHAENGHEHTLFTDEKFFTIE